MAHTIPTLWGELQTGPADPMLTADDLLHMPDDARGYELLEGRLLKMSPASGEHGYLVARLSAELTMYVDQRRLGAVMAAETGFRLSATGQPDTVLAPDVAFVRASRIPPRSDPQFSNFWRLAPDLVAEIASPSQRRAELHTKAQTWLAAGAEIVWLVWPEDSEVEIWRPGAQAPQTLTKTDTLDGEGTLSGFSYPLARLFAALP